MKLRSFSPRLILLILVPGMRLSLASADLPPPAPPPPQVTPGEPARNKDALRPTYLQDVLPILMGKCVRCHNDQTVFLRNWLDYSAAARDRWEIKRRVWDSWRGAYFKQAMPAGTGTESQAITEQERRTIRDWVKCGAPYGIPSRSSPQLSKTEKIEAGRLLFSSICAACHQPSGLGIPTRFPPLAASDFLNADKRRAIKIVLNGLQGEVVVNGQKFNNSMPRLPLSDQDVANALTYVYNSFGNSGKDVIANEVSAARAEKPDLLSPVGRNGALNPSDEKSPWE